MPVFAVCAVNALGPSLYRRHNSAPPLAPIDDGLVWHCCDACRFVDRGLLDWHDSRFVDRGLLDWHDSPFRRSRFTRLA